MISHVGIHFEEKAASLFSPDTILPVQYLQIFRRKIPLEPEKRLLSAILEDAICCFQRYVLAPDKRGKRLFLEAERWVMEEDSDWLFSFDNICEVLELDPQFVREGLLRWKKMKLAKLSKAEIYQLQAKRARKKPGWVVAASATEGHGLQRAGGH